MKNTNRILYALIPIGLLMGSCASTQQTAGLNDGVYFTPSSKPVSMASVVTPEPAPASSSDDYYDAKTSEQLGANQDYYDMTYNDPYYYNYGRFGFNQGLSPDWNSVGSGMGMGIGMGMGMGMGYGFGSGFGNGFGSSFGYGSGFGGMYGNPYGGFNNPWGPGYGHYNPWNSGAYGYGGYGGYYGGSGYYGPYGNYGSGYVPVTYGDAPRNVVVNHRPSIGSGSRVSTGPGTRPNTRNLIGLGSGYRTEGGRTTNGTYRSTGLDPARDQRINDNQHIQGTRTTPNKTTERRSSFEQRGTFDNGGSRSSPSIGGGGGGTRGGGGGGSFSTPTRR